MSYGEEHTIDECDKCLENVGKKYLTPVPFLFKDMNDESHKDLGKGYRQYYICKKCNERGY